MEEKSRDDLHKFGSGLMNLIFIRQPPPNSADFVELAARRDDEMLFQELCRVVNSRAPRIHVPACPMAAILRLENQLAAENYTIMMAPKDADGGEFFLERNI